MELEIADVCTHKSIKAFMVCPSTTTSDLLAFPINQYKGLGL